MPDLKLAAEEPVAMEQTIERAEPLSEVVVHSNHSVPLANSRLPEKHCNRSSRRNLILQKVLQLCTFGYYQSNQEPSLLELAIAIRRLQKSLKANPSNYVIWKFLFLSGISQNVTENVGTAQNWQGSADPVYRPWDSEKGCIVIIVSRRLSSSVMRRWKLWKSIVLFGYFCCKCVLNSKSSSPILVLCCCCFVERC